MADVRFDRFYRHDELLACLRALEAERPDLLSLETIGQSHEGRAIVVAVVTRRSTGRPEDKPAFWVDGNIHATEITGSSACLFLLRTLLDQDGKDHDVTRALDTRTFYVCPRVNPDGAEWALADAPRLIRSSTRPYPHDAPIADGLEVSDVDGDGVIRQMRVRDPNGAWKAHPDEPRLMIRRDPIETGGTYFRLMPEGRVHGYDGFTLRRPPAREGLDLNRNFPAAWRQEFEQQGAGPYPTSEPEVRAVVAFFAAHPNLGGALSFHTYSGVLLRPFGHLPDSEMEAEDLWFYERAGREGTALTGYPNVSVHHGFRYHPKQVIGGTFDWVYDHLGIFTWTIEIWSPMRAAGITDYHPIDWFREHPAEDDLKLLRWSDEVLGGAAYAAWTPFEHPELGPVEIGGFDSFNTITNVPLPLLASELARFPRWIVWQALTSPKLELRHASAEPLGDGVYRVRVVPENTGYLPTYVSKRALARGVSPALVGELVLPKGAALVTGKLRLDAGQLEGKSHKGASLSFFPDAGITDDRTVLEWLVRGAEGARVSYRVAHARAGVIEGSVTLGASERK